MRCSLSSLSALLALGVLAIFQGCGSGDPFAAVAVEMLLDSPYRDPADRDTVQEVVQVDLVTGCTLFTRLAFFDEIPGEWPVETIRTAGAAGYLTFRALYSCAQIQPARALVYSFQDLQGDLDALGGLAGAGTLIVDDDDMPIAAGDPLLTGATRADVELVITQDASPDPDGSNAYFLYNGVRLNPGLPNLSLLRDGDAIAAASRCLVIDKIVIRPHDPDGMPCPGNL